MFNSVFRPIHPPKSDGQRKSDMQPTLNQDTFTVPEGPVAFQWPTNLGRDSFQDVKDWMMLQLRKIERSIPAKEPRDQKEPDESRQK
jgi:hypothetical protein